MRRVITAAIALPLVLAAAFLAPPIGFYVVVLVAVEVAVLEFVGMARRWAPGAPLWMVPLMVAVATAPFAAWLALPGRVWADGAGLLSSGAGLPISLTAGLLALGLFAILRRTPIGESMSALGAVAFAVPYFALTIVSLSYLQALDPWLLLLLFAIVWAGDTAAYYVGSAFGRRRLAPIVSPNKTWEGALAGLGASALAAVTWDYLRMGGILRVEFVAAGLLVGAAAQLGDLLESTIKRQAGVKDSGSLLPGHGGMWDRLDALFVAAPAMLLAMWAAWSWAALEMRWQSLELIP